jgi:hypothetical protein
MEGPFNTILMMVERRSARRSCFQRRPIRLAAATFVACVPSNMNGSLNNDTPPASFSFMFVQNCTCLFGKAPE